jgi:hypothetical protein
VLSTAQIKRNRAAALTRHRAPDDPELAAARTQMGEEKFIAAVERALASAPPIRPDVRDRVIALLSTTGGTSAA